MQSTLTADCPLACYRLSPRVSVESLTHSEFAGYANIALPHLPLCMPLSCETFRLEPATRQFVWSFAPMPISCHRVVHQNGSGLLPAFPPASASTGIVHCLSGPSSLTFAFPPAPAFSSFTSPVLRSPWSVFQYGSESSAYSPVFSLFSPYWGLFNFPSRYFFSIGLLLVFSLRCFHHRFALHYQAALLYPSLLTSGLSPALAPLSIGSFVRWLTMLPCLPLGLLPVQSPLLRKSLLVSSPVLIDMLKSRTLSSTLYLLEPQCFALPFAFYRVRHRHRNLVIPYRSVSLLSSSSLHRPLSGHDFICHDPKNPLLSICLSLIHS